MLTGVNKSKTLGRHAGKFAKHVLPAAVKPVHSLWHQILGVVFLSIAASCIWEILRHTKSLGTGRIVILGIFILILIPYGISSFLKARRISRS